VSKLFETKPCSRCGGSGRYSYNSMHGDMCYGCRGVGEQYTKAGRAARDAWVAAYTETLRCEDIVPGQALMVSDPMRGREVYRIVTESGPDPLNEGMWMLKFDASKGGLGGYGAFPGTEFRVPKSKEEKRLAYESIAHMPGALGWGVTS